MAYDSLSHTSLVPCKKVWYLTISKIISLHVRRVDKEPLKELCELLKCRSHLYNNLFVNLMSVDDLSDVIYTTPLKYH